MKFLAYINIEHLSRAEKLEISERLILANLVSNNLLNFSEVMNMAILTDFKQDSSKKVLLDLIEIYNRGNV